MENNLQTHDILLDFVGRVWYYNNVKRIKHIESEDFEMVITECLVVFMILCIVVMFFASGVMNRLFR